LQFPYSKYPGYCILKIDVVYSGKLAPTLCRQLLPTSLRKGSALKKRKQKLWKS